jgi:hypothetical protein
MASKFLNNTADLKNLAQEYTLEEINDKMNLVNVNVTNPTIPISIDSVTISDVNLNGQPQTDLLNVNSHINNLPTTTGIGNSNTATQRIIIASDQPTLTTNSNLQVNGTQISTNSGSSDANTQRVIIATNQPTLTTNSNIKINGNDPSTNSGTADVNTQRIIIASDQPTLTNNSNMQINGVTVSSNTGNTDNQTQRIIIASDQPTLTTNSNIKINGNNPATNVGTADANTQRIIIASDQPVLTNNSNLQINNSSVSFNSGTTDNQTQRVIIASDQPTLTNNSNLQINGNQIATNTGVTDLNTLRIVQSDNQQYINHAPKPVTILNNYRYYNHKKTDVRAELGSGNLIYLLQNFDQALGNVSVTNQLSLTLGTFVCNLPDNPILHVIISDDANDIIGGTGLQKVEIKYFATQSSDVLSSITVDMNGTTGANLVSMWRVVDVLPAQYGSQNYNLGTIAILQNGAFIPGRMLAGRPYWSSGHIYIPKPTNNPVNGTKQLGDRVRIKNLTLNCSDSKVDKITIVDIWYRTRSSTNAPRFESYFNAVLEGTHSHINANMDDLLEIPVNGLDMFLTYNKEAGSITYLSAFVSYSTE